MLQSTFPRSGPSAHSGSKTPAQRQGACSDRSHWLPQAAPPGASSAPHWTPEPQDRGPPQRGPAGPLTPKGPLPWSSDPAPWIVCSVHPGQRGSPEASTPRPLPGAGRAPPPACSLPTWQLLVPRAPGNIPRGPAGLGPRPAADTAAALGPLGRVGQVPACGPRAQGFWQEGGLPLAWLGGSCAHTPQGFLGPQLGLQGDIC